MDILKQQADLAASKQELSQEVRAQVEAGQRVVVLLTKALKEHYGPKAEKLTAFGLQPFRGRKTGSPVVEKPVETTPAAPAADTTSDR